MRYMHQVLLLAAVLLTLSACGDIGKSSSNISNTGSNTGTETPADPDSIISDNHERGSGTNPKSDRNQEIGYVRNRAEDLKLMDNAGNEVEIDREAMARIINKLLLQNGSFQETATLVTDRNVLIAYQKTEDLDENKAAEIARKTAESVMPRYYHVYVSGKPQHMRDLHSLHNSKTTEDIQATEDKIIKEMKTEPQGH